MSIELKIKSKSLAEEAKIIRFEEKKTLISDKRNSLYLHRVIDVRNEARATFLARAFISNVPYGKVERKIKDEVKLYTRIIPRIVTMVNKYHVKVTYSEIESWILASIVYR